MPGAGADIREPEGPSRSEELYRLSPPAHRGTACALLSMATWRPRLLARVSPPDWNLQRAGRRCRLCRLAGSSASLAAWRTRGKCAVNCCVVSIKIYR